MKIAIVSDIHDNLPNLEKFLRYVKENKIKTIICCGDVTNQETVTRLSAGFQGDIFLVRGNADIYDKEILIDLENIVDLGRVGRVKLDSLQIGLCHEPYLFDKVVEQGECDIVFYGHTHKPWEENKQATRFINPGTLSGMFTLGTFATLDTNTKNLELIIVNNIL